MSQYQIINPYNFVPFSKAAPSRTSPEQIYKDPSALLHGYLDIHLLNTSPLIIPESQPYQEDKLTEHKYYHFYRLPDDQSTPAIPGSEVRGLIRGVYETVTNSCTAVLLDHNDYAMRTSLNGSFKQTGLLEYDPANKVWRLHSAVVNLIPLDERTYYSDLKRAGMRYKGKYRNGQMVYVTGSYKNSSVVESSNPDARPGWILFNEPAVAPGRNKVYNVRILEKGNSLLKIWNDKDDKHDPYRMLDEVLSEKNAQSSQNKARSMPAHDDYRAALQNVKKHGGCLPVWYLPVKRGSEILYYLSNASIGRVHIMRTWEEIMGSHSPCKAYNALCPACTLFGNATEDGSLKSRLQFTDALLQGEPQSSDFGNRTLDILSTPRPSAYEFYIRKPDGNRVQYWNYDYYGVRSENGLEYRDMTDAAPRGRKYYWHGKINERSADKGNQNNTMEYLKEGHRFLFRIYFNGITEKQLSALKYAITLGENLEKSPLQHKIGHARPLGYGSVKLVIDREIIRTVRKENELIISCLEERAVPETVMPPQDADPSPLLALKAICDRRKTEGKAVGYPTYTKGKGEPAVYEWFTYNRQVNWKALPEPTDRVIAVPSANGDPLTDATWNSDQGKSWNNGNQGWNNNSSRPGTGRQSFGRQSDAGSKSYGAPRPEGVRTYASSAPVPVSSGEVMPGTVIDHAVIDKVLGTSFVYVLFGKSNDPNEPKTLKGKINYQQSSRSKYRVGNEVRIKVIRFHPNEKYYDVSLW